MIQDFETHVIRALPWIVIPIHLRILLSLQ
jgi:hypothetical protein